jgi:GntR family transcriptional regulator/MocR family aminotransferase
VVVVEDPGYFPAWSAFRAVGAEVVGVPVDAQGLRTDLLAKLLEQRQVRLVYVTPNHQYPTTVKLSIPRRRVLLSLTRAHGVPILEDDYDHEYHFRGAPQVPLAASQDAAHVIYIATLSKLIAPALRVGIIAGESELLHQLAAHRRIQLRSGDGVSEAALAEWIAQGGFERHLRRARRVYAARRDAAVEALSRHTAELGVEFKAPDGGLAVWTRWPGLDTLELARRALARGVAVLPSKLMTLGAPHEGIRLAYGCLDSPAFLRAVEILSQVARDPSL